VTAPALLRTQLESEIGVPLVIRERLAPETLATGIREIDTLTHGIPRGCLTELTGPASSGRTTAAVSLMARATAGEEFCALIDATDAFDPETAAGAGVDLARLLWVRCGGDAERALKAADLIVQAGGFGLVILDLADVPRLTARRISLTSWFRLRRAVENTPAALVAISRESNAKSCASLTLELAPRGPRWSGTPGCSQVLRGMDFEAARVKPAAAARARFAACSRAFM
jgi:hypothetical protein